MEVASFAEMEEEFFARIAAVVWCNVATQDTRGRIRSRILHPIWEPGPVGWIATRRHSFKTTHLDQHPYISLAYVGDDAKPVYVDCRTEWDDSLETKQRIWDLFFQTPPPLGYDPAPIFTSPDHPNFGMLKLIPWRVEVYNFPAERFAWHNPAE